jgi:hypothetical protein
LKRVNINSFVGNEAIFPEAAMGVDLHEVYFSVE